MGLSGRPLPPDAPTFRRRTAISFGGTTEYLQLDGLAALFAAGSFTASFAVKMGASASLRMLLATNTSAGDNRLLCRVAAGASVVGFTVAAADIAGTRHANTNVTDGAWHLVTWSWDSSATVVTLYVDGAAEFTSDPIAIAWAADDSVQFGMEYDGAAPGDYYDGDLQHIAVWSAAVETHAPALWASGRVADPRLMPTRPEHMWCGDVGWARIGHDWTGHSIAASHQNMTAADLVASGMA